ncbi:hypothetical protein BOTBODRAFT_30544 [Botryobasidium botryosum FD-172 SS1]|uniref:HMG box domain-containing protein n=1 Tax=Botryobasidium botryosum (strain FD-172 SS1) TaxID=930990 RepID=A0A067MYK0_BOTB1|nr:hypothetical protein BOTBODRAFT_30544 [Botryobasidium botryosum FD-172 SS1]
MAKQVPTCTCTPRAHHTLKVIAVANPAYPAAESEMNSLFAARRVPALFRSTFPPTATLHRTLFASPRPQLAARVPKSSSNDALAEDKPGITVVKRATAKAGAAKKAKDADAKPKVELRSKTKATTTKARQTPAKSKVKAATKPKELKVAKPAPIAVKKTAMKEPRPVLFTPPPKGPGSPYVLYYLEQLGHSSEVPSARLADQRWRKLTDAKKQVWMEKSSLKRTEWKKELVQWKTQQTPEGLKQYRLQTRKYRREIQAIQRASYATPRPIFPQTGYMRFLSEYRADPKNWEGAPEGTSVHERQVRPRYIIKHASAKWREMSDAEKAPYTAPAEEAFKKYRKDVVRWLEVEAAAKA